MDFNQVQGFRLWCYNSTWAIEKISTNVKAFLDYGLMTQKFQKISNLTFSKLIQNQMETIFRLKRNSKKSFWMMFGRF